MVIGVLESGRQLLMFCLDLLDVWKLEVEAGSRMSGPAVTEMDVSRFLFLSITVFYLCKFMAVFFVFNN